MTGAPASLHLEVRADNAAALGLYRAMGFAADGRRRDYYGRGHDALLMSLRLSGAAGDAGAGEPRGVGRDGRRAAGAGHRDLVRRDRGRDRPRA